MSKCEAFLAACLDDLSEMEDTSCEQAVQLRYVAMTKLKELSCGCMSSPVEIQGVRFQTPVEAMDALRRVIELTFAICERATGPVIETIWKDPCLPRYRCNRPCDDHDGEYHYGETC